MDKNQHTHFEFLKEGEILLLKSYDPFFKTHYVNSPLNLITNFSGTEGEAIVEKSGQVKIFVDTRYHKLVDKQVYSDIEVYKMPLGETFIEAFKKCYKKNTTLYVPFDISLSFYLKLYEYFNIKTYESNETIETKADLFLIKEEGFLEKIKKINSKNNLLVFNLDEISYLTNIRSFQAPYSSNFKSILYLDFKNSNHTLFVEKIPSFKVKGLNFKKLPEFKSFISKIEDEIEINYNDITLADYSAIKNPKKMKTDLSYLASIKNNAALEDLKDASNKLDLAILNFKKQLKEGLSEFELVEIFEHELLKTGLKAPSFKTILALDENCASIHYSSYDKNKFLKPESLILLDCGGYSANGYATDITRTFYFGSNPHPFYKKIYSAVLKAFILCFLSKEKSAKKLDLIAREFLEPYNNEGFYFNHGLGHGIGTSCHQNPPRLAMGSSDTIEPYQTHSIEPGLYGKKDDLEFGVRIENCVYFNNNYERFSLSKFPFEEKLIDYDIFSNSEQEFIKKWQGGFNGGI